MEKQKLLDIVNHSVISLFFYNKKCEQGLFQHNTNFIMLQYKRFFTVGTGSAILG